MKGKIYFLIFLVFVNVTPAYSTQIIEVFDDAEISATISSSELNRIKIKGDRIKDVLTVDGKFYFEETVLSELGELYLKTTGSVVSTVSIYIHSELGKTYKMLLIPKKISGEQIFLIDKELEAETKIKISDDYAKEIADFVINMKTGSFSANYRTIHNLVRLKRKVGDKFRLSLKTKYTPKKEGFIGEVFEVENISKTASILKHSDFYREGVKAIRFSKQYLSSKEKGLIYIIK